MYNEKTLSGSSITPSKATAVKVTSDPVAAAIEEYRMIYPEVFYKIMPYIMMACDQLDAYGDSMPNQEMMDQMTENIYRDMMEMYPELSDYIREYENRENNNSNNENKNSNTAQTITRFPGYYRQRYRRRGLFRDLIDILFLSEFHRRRRRRYY